MIRAIALVLLFPLCVFAGGSFGGEGGGDRPQGHELPDALHNGADADGIYQTIYENHRHVVPAVPIHHENESEARAACYTSFRSENEAQRACPAGAMAARIFGTNDWTCSCF